MRNLETKYWFGEMVYLKHDPEQLPRMVTDIEFCGSPNKPRYHLSIGGECYPHYDYEITREPNELIKMGFIKREKDN